MARTVLIPQDVDYAGKKYLLERGYRLKVGCGIEPEVLKREIAECEALLLRTAVVNAELLDAAPSLKVVAKHGIGVDNVDVEAATERGVYVTFAPLSNNVTVAEHTVSMMLALARGLIRSDREMRLGNFDIRTQQLGTDLEGKTLGLIGLGRIGLMVAHKAISGFNMRVIGYDPYAGVEAAKLGVTQLPDMAQVLAQSDFVSLHLPLTPITKGLIGERELAVMKESGYLISAARGGIVDETALERALQSGKLAGAALDVFEEEPPAPGHPLFALDQVIVTPHNAALTKEATERMSLHAAISIDEVLSGKTPSWPVNRPPFRKDGKGEGL